MIFVCYLYHAVSTLWTGFTVNPDHPSARTVRMTEGLLCSDTVRLINESSTGFARNAYDVVVR